MIHVNYITEKIDTLIFARTGVMENNKNKVFLYHIPIILGQKKFFSSINKYRRGATPATPQMTKEKNFLALKHLWPWIFAPRKDTHL